MTPHLSVVVTTRNDNHGHNMLYRMQHFVTGWIEQCKRHELSAELIIVEWNPPEGAKLVDVLRFPVDMGPCTVRFIRVPQEIHATVDYSDKIPLFQMLGKNVGIRRAKGEFVLATNVDILFSDQLVHYLKHNLQKGFLYRVDRLDIPATVPEKSSFDELLQFCKKTFFRINGKHGTRQVMRRSFWEWLKKTVQIYCQRARQLFHYKCKVASFKLKSFRKIAAVVWTLMECVGRCIWKRLCALCFSNRYSLHTNACGDFTLLTAEKWGSLRGYPEWALFSWHIDSILLHQAKQHGIREVDLRRKYAVYHIDHEHGYSADQPNTLFDRLDVRGIPYLTDADLRSVVAKLKKSTEKVVYNEENWGLADRELEEISL